MDEWLRWGTMCAVSAVGAYLSARNGTKKALEEHHTRLTILETETRGIVDRLERVEDVVFPVRH